MAHFGVQKAKSKALVALATVAAFAGAAGTAPVDAAGGELQIGTFSIAADGSLPAVEGGWSQNYNYTDYSIADDETGLHKIVKNDYFGCDDHVGSSGSGVLLKNKEAFENFVTNNDGAADKMIQICEQVVNSHKSGKVGEYNINVDVHNGRPYESSIYTNNSGEFFTITTNLDYVEGATLSEKNETGLVTIRNTYRNGDGKLVFQVTPRKHGDTRLVYERPDGTSIKDFALYVSDINDRDAEGNIYYTYRDRHGDDYFNVYAQYIGSEDLDLPNVDVAVPAGVYLELGSDTKESISETGSNDAYPVGSESSPLKVKLGNLNTNLHVNPGSVVSFEGNINSNIDAENSSIIFKSGTTQTGDERRTIRGHYTEGNAKLTFEGGNYNNIQIVSNNVDVQGGTFKQTGKAGTTQSDYLLGGYGTGSITISGEDTKFEHVVEAPEGDDAIWHNDTYAMFYTYGANFVINDGTFVSNGSILSGESVNSNYDVANYTINGGNFNAKHIAAYSNDWKGTLTINDGDFKTTDRFYVWDALEGWEDGKILNKYDSLPAELGTVGEVVRYTDSTGGEHRNWGTGTMGRIRTLVEPTTTNMSIKGGDYSDGYNSEDGTGIVIASGYDQVELDTDYDNDGRKDVRVLPAPVYNVTLNIGEKSDPLNIPEGAEIISFEGEDTVCAAELVNGQVIFTGLSVGDCSVKISDKETKINIYDIVVNDNTNYTDGDPISIPVGDTKTPEDLGGKNPEDLDWAVIEGRDNCTVDDNGVITAVKAGTCKVTARDPETGNTIVWNVTTTEPLEIGVGESKKPSDLPDGAEDGEWSSSDENVCTVASDGTITGKKAGTCFVTLKLDGKVYTWKVTITGNPDTSDKNRVALFTIAGAVAGGFAAMAATARRFFGRK